VNGSGKHSAERLSPEWIQLRTIDTGLLHFYIGPTAEREEGLSSVATDPKRSGMLSIIAALLTPS
jgi:hypothetical protein